jgi:CheY-like chemotaxis protein
MSRPPHIVVVDDDPSILTLLTATLKGGLGAQVTSFPSAEAALAAWPTLKGVDLLLTDHSMPGVTGLELAARVRGTAPGLPIVMLSAVELEPDAPGVVTRCLTKPCPPRVLLPELRGLLGLAAPEPPAPAPSRPPSRLAELEAAYLGHLATVPPRLEALAAAAVDAAGERALRDLLHQLAGTAGSYGHGQVADAALALRAAVVAHQRLAPALAELQRALGAVLEAQGRE